jgi:hypothetical protein
MGIYEPHRKHRLIYCCFYSAVAYEWKLSNCFLRISYRRNVFIEPLPSNGSTCHHIHGLSDVGTLLSLASRPWSLVCFYYLGFKLSNISANITVRVLRCNNCGEALAARMGLSVSPSSARSQPSPKLITLKMAVAVWVETLGNFQNSMAHISKAKISNLLWLLIFRPSRSTLLPMSK